MNDITIVTAFFDIGRGEWTPDKGLPHYLHRTNDVYLQRFGHLSKLDNKVIVFTSEEFAQEVKDLRGDKDTVVVVLDFDKILLELKKKVKEVQESEDYRKKINPYQILNPEYWNTDYVVVNLLKSTFVRRAIQMNAVETDLVAWLDFGYCREPINCTKWSYPFNKDKIHFFTIKDWVEGTYIQDVIANNDVHITGPCIVAGKDMWINLEALVNHNTQELLKNNLIDDDQTVLLMSYLSRPELFELHKVSPSDWFVAFKEYNENLS